MARRLVFEDSYVHIHANNARTSSSLVNSPPVDYQMSKVHSASTVSGPSINSDSRDISELTDFDQNDANGGCCQDCLYLCGARCRRMGCKTMFRDRYPKGFVILVVLLINTLENLAIYGAFKGLQDRISGSHVTTSSPSEYVFIIFQWCGGRILYPITGLIADTWVGRYRMIKYGLFLMWIGFVIIALNESLIYSHMGYPIRDTFFEKYYFLPCIAVVLLIISSASIEANIIPFGADQVQQGASNSEISSYFYYFYLSRIIGMFLGITVFLLMFDTHVSVLPNSKFDTNDFTFVTLTTIHPIFAVFALTVALVFHFCTRQKYFMDRDHKNPLKLIINVLCYAATVKRSTPIYRKSFRYGEERKKRIELAKSNYDGIFTSEEVEDVKTFFRICLVILSLSGSFLTFQLIVRALGDQLMQTSMQLFDAGHFSFLPNELFNLIHISVMVVSLIVTNHFIVPLFPGLQMRLKIGLGVLFTALAPAAAMVFQFALVTFDVYPLIHLVWLILPITFLGIGHMNINTAGLEFIYAQSPNNMKGLLTGVFYFWYGLFNAVGIIFHGNYPSEEDSDWMPTIGIYYAITTFVGALSIVMYAAVACIYSNRVRPSSGNEVEDDAVRRGMYGHVSTLNFPHRSNSDTL